MPHATFARPDLGSFCRLDELGLQVAAQRIESGRAVLACRVVETDELVRWCRRRGGEAAPRDSVTRRLAHEPLGWCPTTLLITIRRYRCTGCGHVSRQDTSRAADAGCDFVVAQGVEAGGHVRGSLGLVPLLSEVLEVVDVPVVAAGRWSC